MRLDLDRWRARVAVGLLLVAGAARGADDGRGAAPAEHAGALVARLGSKDAAERGKAAGALEAMGAAARAALVRGVNGNDPAVRMAAAPLLLRLPFDRAEDPADVRQLLQGYGKGDPDARKAAVVKLTVRAPAAAPGLLFRLMREEPSDDVRWAILGQIRRVSAIPSAPAGAAPQDIPRAPNLALAGLVVGRTDPNLAMALLERAVELENRRPTKEPEVVLTYFDLAVQYAQRRRFDDAAEMHRRGYARNPAARIMRQQESTDHLQLLFTLHARYGPLKGFADDLATFGPELARRPQLTYAVGRAYERGGQPVVAEALYRAAYFGTPDVPRLRREVGAYLMGIGASGAAERQFEAVLAGAAGDGRSLEAIDARLQLALIAAGRGQDFAAAEGMRRVLEGPLPAGMRFTWRASNGRAKAQTGDAARAGLEAQMHWRYLRAARGKHDANSVRAHLKELLRLRPETPEIAMDAVPLLKELGRTEDAARLFEAPYAAAKAELDARPDDPQRMNQLAWLCARCGERLAEAKGLAEGAMKLAPENPAYLDTAAEVAFRMGDAGRAVELERRAIELRPGDGFMREQLKRFEGGERDR